MKILILLLLSLQAQAGNLISKNIRLADGVLHEKWESSVKHMNFPLLPKVDELKDDSNLPFTERQRYIFHLEPKATNVKDKYLEANNWWIVYKMKAIGGMYVLIVHPDYIQCFENLEKKFDSMQWVVTYWGKIEGFKALVLEQPRQCIGNYDRTGGKLDEPIL